MSLYRKHCVTSSLFAASRKIRLLLPFGVRPLWSLDLESCYVPCHSDPPSFHLGQLRQWRSLLESLELLLHGASKLVLQLRRCLHHVEIGVVVRPFDSRRICRCRCRCRRLCLRVRIVVRIGMRKSICQLQVDVRVPHIVPHNCRQFPRLRNDRLPVDGHLSLLVRFRRGFVTGCGFRCCSRCSAAALSLPFLCRVFCRLSCHPLCC